MSATRRPFVTVPILQPLAVVSEHFKVRFDEMILRRSVRVRVVCRLLRDIAGHGDRVPHVRTKSKGLAAKIPQLAVFVCEHVDFGDELSPRQPVAVCVESPVLS